MKLTKIKYHNIKKNNQVNLILKKMLRKKNKFLVLMRNIKDLHLGQKIRKRKKKKIKKK